MAKTRDGVSVQPRFKGTWQADFRHEGKRIRKSGFSSEGEARGWAITTKKQLEEGVPLSTLLSPEAGDGWTLQKLLDSTHERYWAGTANEDDAVRNATQVIEIIGKHKHPRDVTTDDVDRLVGALSKKENSSGTINRKLAALSKMLRHAERKGLLSKVPPIERKREDQGRIRWYTIEEEVEILKACTSESFRQLLLFLVETGCRIGEALLVRWQDVDQLHVRFHKTKNGMNRAVPLSDDLRSALQDRRQEGHKPSGLIFDDWDYDAAYREWVKVKEQVGLTEDDEACIHAFRHTCASRLVQTGAPLQLVQQWLGHKTLEMTMRYAHLSPMNWAQASMGLRSVTSGADRIRFVRGSEPVVTNRDQVTKTGT